MIRPACLAGVLLLAACSGGEPGGTATAPAATAASVPAVAGSVAPAGAQAVATLARYDGYGDMRFGMDEQAFAQAWQGELERLGPAGEACFYQTPTWVDTPSDFAFMFEAGRFVRYDVGTTKETAPGGGKVGMSAAQIHALYGARVSELPHKYVTGGKVLRVTGPRDAGVLVFETDAQGKVTRWRAGIPPQVDYVEGCG
ncbi:lectin [Frateuria sp. STR12]|uniref:lectin n=1 Tax=Frateuria hangzhouensis TaxID=2995589 RepID=UPI0022609008|nr:lectin [Frateuria sp. STR12]MCX7514557.1 lectin [Frateuria sp. STR12]